MPREARINSKIRNAIAQQKSHLQDLVLSLDDYYKFLQTYVSLEKSEDNVNAVQGSLQMLDLQCDVCPVLAVLYFSIDKLDVCIWNKQ